MYPKSVYLDYGSSSNERYVTEEGYEAIKALIQQYQMCGKCKSVIDQDEHRLVGRHLCLSCLLQHQSGLRFLGPVDIDSDGDYTYSYIDDENNVYTSKANRSDSAVKDTYGSILRAGFKIPEYYVPFKGDKDNPIKLGRYNFTAYGSLTQSAIVLEYKDTYPNIHVVFIAYKEGQFVELNKRNLVFKQMFERAKAIVESTKKHGYYNINGYEQARYSDETLYPIIARMEAAVWDVQKALMPVYKQPEPVEATPQPLEVEEVNENPDPVNMKTEHVNESEESLTRDQPDQAEQIEQETLSVADSVPEEIAPVLPENGETEQGSLQVDAEIETGITPEETPAPEESSNVEETETSNIEDGKTSKRGKRGRLSLVSQEEQTNG